MTTSRFDQKVDEPYGSCETCKIGLPTQALAREHMDATYEASRGKRASHRILISNATRNDRISNELDSLVDEAITSVTEDVDELVEDGHITREEATAAIARWSDFADEWSRAGLDQNDDESSTPNTATHTP